MVELSEKYRPRTLDEILGQDEIIEAIKAKDYPKNYLLIGPSGSGKTTTAYALADRYGIPILEKNASDERGIDVVRDEIKRATLTRGRKLILLDEADRLCLTEDTEIIVGTLSCPAFKKLSDLTVGERISILSVNPETLELENDKGCLVDSGTNDFFRVTTEDGYEFEASAEHPFFNLYEGKLKRIRLGELNPGDEIVEMENLFNYCEICGKRTFNERFCSIECKDEGHAIQMSGSGNPMFGTTWNEERRKKIVSKLSDGRFSGENNPNYGGVFHGERTLYEDWTEESKERHREKAKKSYFDKFGVNELNERAKRNPLSKIERIKTNIWIADKLKGEVFCEDCGEKLETNYRRCRKGVYIHHKDGNRNNHTIENIKFVCPKCHNTKEHDQKPWLYSPIIVRNGIKIKSIVPVGRKKAWNITMERNRNFFLANGILTHNTDEAMDALRRIMENPKSEAFFVLTGNDGWRFTPAIKSRCTDFTFKRIEDKTILLHLIDICKKEGIEIEPESKEGLVQLVVQANGDMRKALNLLEKVVDKDAKITKKTVMSFVKPKTSGIALKTALDGDFEKAKDLIEDAFFDNLQSPKDILIELYESIEIEVKKKEWRILLYRELAKCEQSIKRNTDPVLPLLQFVGFLSYAWLLPHYPDSLLEVRP